MLLNCLQFINCKKVGDKRYTLEDSNISCDSDYFKNFLFPINMTVAVILGFIIPLFIFFILVMGNRKE